MELLRKFWQLSVIANLLFCVALSEAAFEPNVTDATSQIVPPLFRFDDYDQCHSRLNPGQGEYCFMRVVRKTDRPDPIDSDRIELSFRRNLLEWGLCIRTCEEEVARLSKQEADRLYQPKFKIGFKFSIPSRYWHERVKPYKEKYGRLLNVCVNNRLKREYNLTHPAAYSEFEYCNDNSDLAKAESRDIDWIKVAFIVLLGALVLTILAANILDWTDNRNNIIVSSFSLRENWKKFVDTPKTTIYQDFGFIDGIRSFIMIYILQIHCMILLGQSALQFPERFETISKYSFTTIIVSLTPISVQTFLVISGLLLTVNFFKDIQNKPTVDGEYLKSKFVNRLIRIVPVYYFFILVTAIGESIPGVDVNAASHKTILTEQQYCRRLWWTNILFVSNLPLSEETCFEQGWYLGTDLQLFVGALALLTAIWRFPKHAKSILWTSVIVSQLVPLGVLLLLRLESSLPVRLR
ncbi:uncharacterized protein LOC129756364 [Uranotaenia lowii]|uniref:uncharacterized protein LOC129756364 n=1 Tax=Uranotaenia lowii TaxID=190385 RepID=UPI0024788FBE|nr:uncharacterized protein LOC129756364 [Uranotaenia lowii]